MFGNSTSGSSVCPPPTLRVCHADSPIFTLDESLPLPPPAPVGTVISDVLATLATDEMSSEAYNVQYLQRHSCNAGAMLGAAKALQIIGGPRDEVEGIVFGILNPEVDLPIKVSHRRLFQCVYNSMLLCTDRT